MVFRRWRTLERGQSLKEVRYKVKCDLRSRSNLASPCSNLVRRSTARRRAKDRPRVSSPCMPATILKAGVNKGRGRVPR